MAPLLGFTQSFKRDLFPLNGTVLGFTQSFQRDLSPLKWHWFGGYQSDSNKVVLKNIVPLRVNLEQKTVPKMIIAYIRIEKNIVGPMNNVASLKRVGHQIPRHNRACRRARHVKVNRLW